MLLTQNQHLFYFQEIIINFCIPVYKNSILSIYAILNAKLDLTCLFKSEVKNFHFVHSELLKFQVVN
jgi:hypothetical protein